ncbi:MAG: hypothetical protein CMH47_08840 [Muricauda sp.]|uniref:hypothetical protein n=1 Tax=Muricauda brasiliensis TaxID=2162892 RepID=UPI000C51BE52|nr:hypothetical protein [Muricauda brasiliensis]MBC71948.1 hypothetical protein [Allomuricauda sp.]MBC72366.1 hypothetical protein [Allomuricauda sp.]|tara:strand:+ start:5749 stop:6183 length:435 start_codon:yes stop_codon:yes gene_type:complete
MKKLAILLSLTSLVINQSCDSTDGEIDFQGINVFELQYINAGMSGEIIEKKDLEFNEFIELTSNYHFVKKRVYPDSTSIAKGSYIFIQSKESKFFEFEYEEESYLIQNCGSSLKEHISILSNKEIFNGGYLPCDGPGFGYRLVN